MSNVAQEAKTLPKGVTEADLKKLIAKHGRLHPIVVELDGQTHVALARKPKLSELMMTAGDGADHMQSASTLFNSCVVAQDEAFAQEDEVRLAGIKAVAGLFRAVEARVGEAYA